MRALQTGIIRSASTCCLMRSSITATHAALVKYKAAKIQNCCRNAPTPLCLPVQAQHLPATITVTQGFVSYAMYGLSCRSTQAGPHKSTSEINSALSRIKMSRVRVLQTRQVMQRVHLKARQVWHNILWKPFLQNLIPTCTSSGLFHVDRDASHERT